MSFRVVTVFALSSFIGCGHPGVNLTLESASGFTPGQRGDAVLDMALTTATTSTLHAGAGNWTTFSFSTGLMTTSPIFTSGAAASAALQAYVSSSSATAGNAKALAVALGLHLGVNAWVVPAVIAGADIEAITVSAPTGSNVSFVSRVNGTTADFVAVSNVVPATAVAGITFSSYKLASGTVVAGNTSTGAVSNLNAGFGAATIAAATCDPNNTTFVYSEKFIDEDFSQGANDSTWPVNIGWTGDFNGDWATDGTTARVGARTASSVNGFVKFLDVCPPSSGGLLSMEADVNTSLLSQALSDTTLVLYFFDASNTFISVAVTSPLRKGSSANHLGFFDKAVPANTRRIAIVPMSFSANGETSSVFYSHLTVGYEPASAHSTATLASENFATPAKVTDLPTGWTDYNGDWFVDAEGTSSWATLWNSTWGGDSKGKPPADTGLSKTFSLGTVASGESLNAYLFAAATFADPTSFVRIRLVFDDAAKTEVDSTRMQGTAWTTLNVRRTAIPATAKNVTVVANAYLGPNETSSLYVDDLSLSTVH